MVDNTQLDRAWAEGEEAYAEGLELDECPYDDDDEERELNREWRAGYAQAEEDGDYA